MIRAVTGILHSLVYDFAQTEAYNFAQPKDVPHIIKCEDDVGLYRMSGAALCQMVIIIIIIIIINFIYLASISLIVLGTLQCQEKCNKNIKT